MAPSVDQTPLVSVVMPVYNAEQYLREAMESILAQTYQHFEFIILNDGSTDSSKEIIDSYEDSRLVKVHHTTNMNYVVRLNEGLERAQGKYVARMDSDDIAHPDRFAKQVAFLEKNPDYGICGSWFETINHPTESHVENYTAHEDLVLHLFDRVPFAHPSVMMRAQVLKEHRLEYSNDFAGTEDYHLWVRLSRVTKMANLPEHLLKYRFHEHQVSTLHADAQKKHTYNIRKSILSYWMETEATDEMTAHMLDIFWQGKDALEVPIGQLQSWVYPLFLQRRKHQEVPLALLKDYFSAHWYRVSMMHKQEGLTVFRTFLKAPFHTYSQPQFWLRSAKLLVRTILR
ncbi:MAG TPA: glycosyl transferase [Cytophagales bacterium]|nr:glycosyl transferase [Cytophagales bacterium]HAA18628.1 glycosyl transferase [Cytophagales bacterium]HAP64568.1 glycosyl transferase [Cytophagales bacterium]